MEKNMICPVCDEGQLHAGSVPSVIDSEHGKLDVERHFHWCDACGTEVTLSKDSRLNALAAKSARRDAARLTTEQICEVLRNLGLTQEAAGTIFGGGSIAFSKYKRSEVQPAEAMDNLLWLIQRHPFLAAELAERHGMPDAVSAIEKKRFKADLLDTTLVAGFCTWDREYGLETYEAIKHVSSCGVPTWAQGHHVNQVLENQKQSQSLVISLERAAA